MGVLEQRGETLGAPLRWLFVPGAALLAGAVSPQIMGFAGLDWQVGLTLGLGLLVGLLVLLGLVQLAIRQQPESMPAPATRGAPLLYALLHGGARQFHWCFQRGAMLVVLVSLAALPASGIETPAYWAMWAAVLIALPGLFFDPPGAPRLFTGIALVSTAILFFYTRNFWLCWALHAGILAFAGVAWLRPELRATT